MNPQVWMTATGALFIVFYNFRYTAFIAESDCYQACAITGILNLAGCECLGDL
jgi:hypothetical protein